MEMLAPLSIRNFNSKAPICASTSRSGGSVAAESFDPFAVYVYFSGFASFLYSLYRVRVTTEGIGRLVLLIDFPKMINEA